MGQINIDFETYSEADLKNVGQHRYAQDRSTDIICLAYSINNSPPEIWIAGDEFPLVLRDAILRGDLVYAWNVGFEFAIWNEIGVKKLNWPVIKLEQWRDTQAIALNFAFPMALDKCGDALDLKVQKDKRGEQLIKLLSVPQKITKKNKYRRLTPETHPELFEEFYEYCKQDVRSEMAILNHFPWELPDTEIKILHHTLRKNQRGIPIDLELVDMIVEKTGEYLQEVSTVVPIITGGKVKTINQRAKIMEWCESQGYELPDFTADTILSALSDPEIENYQNVKSLLEIRQLAGKSSIKKFQKIQEAICRDGRIRDCLKYHKATTGREGGRLLQPQNLPRATVPCSDGQNYMEAINQTIHDFKTKDLSELMGIYDTLLFTSSALIRPSICASKGKELVVSDYSQIENRMLCWLAEQEDVLELIRSGMDTYKDMASHLYDQAYDEIPKDSRRRRHGKLTILGGGYGMGYRKFWRDCVEKQKFDITLEEAKKTIDTFRSRYNKVVDLWYGLKKAAIEAVLTPGKITNYLKISFMHTSGHLFMILPNGKSICYPQAWVSTEVNDWGKAEYVLCHMGLHSKTKKWIKHHITPGRLTENASQGSAREVLFEAILELESMGYNDIILTVHDEVVLETRKGELSINQVNEVLCNRSEIWEGLPLNADGFISERYRK